MNEIVIGVGQIIFNTPLWVWILLVILVHRGLALRTDYVFSLARSLVMPGIFALWGLSTIVMSFKDPGLTIGLYVGAMPIGVVVGYVVYAHCRHMYVREGIWYASGSLVPLGIIVVNFARKYALNVVMSVQPAVTSSMGFEAIYGLSAGISIGLFIGGIVNSVAAQHARTEKGVAWER